MRTRIWSMLLAVVLVLAMVTPGWGATYYVDPLNGSDAGGVAGTSFATAWKSTAHAAGLVAAGDTVRLCATATETPTGSSTPISFTTNGASGSLISWIGYDATGVNPLTAGNYYTISGASLTGATTDIANLTGTSNQFNNLKFVGGPRYNTYSATNPQDDKFTNCYFGNAGTALIGSAANVSIGLLMYGCVFTSCPVAFGGYNSRAVPSCSGCVFSSISSSVCGSSAFTFMQGNAFLNNGTCFAGYTGTVTNVITGNTFYNNTVAIGINDRGGSVCYISGNTFCKNGTALAMAGSTSYPIYANYNHYGTGSLANTNNFTGNASVVLGPNDVTGDPLFNNAAGGDFRLKSGSPLIGSGPGGINIGAMGQMPASGSFPVIGSVIVRATP